MIRLLPETHDDLLVVEASQKLTADDYKNTFKPAMQERIDKYGRIDVMMRFADDFNGFEAGAMWEDAKFGTSHRHDFHKIALVGLPHSIQWMTNLASHISDFEVKNFEPGYENEAETWLSVH